MVGLPPFTLALIGELIKCKKHGSLLTTTTMRTKLIPNEVGTHVIAVNEKCLEVNKCEGKRKETNERANERERVLFPSREKSPLRSSDERWEGY